MVLEVNFAAPAKGNEKGGVEGIIGYLQDNFFSPIPSFGMLEALNFDLAAFCERHAQREHTTHQETIAARFNREQAALRPLPPALPRSCVTRYARVNKFAEVVFERDVYSVPSRYAHRNVAIEVYEDRLRIILEDAAIAQHGRGFGRGERFLDPRHYLELLRRKHRAAEHALVLADGRIPESLHDLLRRYQDDGRVSASKRWTEVLSLLADHSAEVLRDAVGHALARGTCDPAAIAFCYVNAPRRPRRHRSTHVICPRAHALTQWWSTWLGTR